MTPRRTLTGDGSSRDDAPRPDANTGQARRYLGWLCVVLFLLMAALAAAVFEPSPWRALLLAVLLVCPLVAVRGFFIGLRPLPFPVGEVPRTNGRVLNWVAPYYDTLCRLAGLGRVFRERTLRAAALRPGESVLDLGCGTGTLAIAAAKIVGSHGHVLGVDAAPDMIRLARIKAAAACSPARFELAAAEALPVPDASVDAVLASLIFHHLPPDSKRRALSETARVLRPGGRLLLADLDRPSGVVARALAKPLGLFTRLSDHLGGRVPALMTEAGFEPPERLGAWRGMLAFWLAHKPASVHSIGKGASHANR